MLGEFKFPPSQFGIFLPVSYKDALFLFLLDTGCSLTIFDSAFAPELAARRVDLQGVGHEPEHALLGKLAFEAPYGVRMGPGFLRPLRRGVLGTEQ